MDVEMKEANSRRRRGGGGAARVPSGSAARRSDPYARDASQRRQVSGSIIYPPPEISIKGSSGPTWVVVANLLHGTTADDIKLTFSTFGPIVEVKTRAPASANHPSIAYELAFERPEDAETAVSKFNGALADGRILQVFIKKPEQPKPTASQFTRAAAQAAAQRPRDAAGNLVPVPGPAVPTGPASMRNKKGTADLLDPRAQAQSKAAGKKQQAPAPAVKSLKDRLPEPLLNRLLTPAQAKKVQAEEARKKAIANMPALQKRISVPLAERLAKQAGTPKSDV